MQLHTEVIRRGLENDEEDNLESEDAKEIVTSQMRLLKRAFERNGGKWESEEAKEAAIAVWNEAQGWFGHFGVESVDKWKKSESHPGTRDMGKWAVPMNWGFLERGTHDWKTAGDALKRVEYVGSSGRVNGHAHGFGSED